MVRHNGEDWPLIGDQPLCPEMEGVGGKAPRLPMRGQFGSQCEAPVVTAIHLSHTQPNYLRKSSRLSRDGAKLRGKSPRPRSDGGYVSAGTLLRSRREMKSKDPSQPAVRFANRRAGPTAHPQVTPYRPARPCREGQIRMVPW
ncbi:hypothetical protein SKAU_G00184410 [Synaphobranchus kaupii]|uniref:Uncharacterized protein n=1 Tax=Synaphobranchus kaupii TaxID=118154 RepID=A0A9Q1FCD0_SYNKA|nr:hypothetical protein SKAU_G00184410 [Synaphobranchus kaupii]